jgi:hypothetical protein
MTAKRKATKHALDALDREVAALQLRRAGCTYDVIARRLGYSNRSGAWHAVRAGLSATLREPADELRGLELERLDRLHEAVWDRAIRGHLASVDRVLAIMKRRSALLGLDAPRRHHVPAALTLQTFAERAATMSGLDSGSLLAEAERILAVVAGEKPEETA